MRYYNFLQKYSISFGGNRARTLLTSSFTTLTLAIESRESHHFPTGTCSYSWSNSMIHWGFPFPFCLLSPCHMLFLFFDFIQGKPHFFWVKLPIFWTKINRVLYAAHQDEKTFPTMWNTWGLPCLVFEN